MAFGALNETINPTQHKRPTRAGGWESGESEGDRSERGGDSRRGRQQRGGRVPSVLARGLPENLHLAQVSGGHGLVDLLLVFVRRLERRRR